MQDEFIYRRPQDIFHVLLQVLALLLGVDVIGAAPNDQTVGAEVRDRVDRVLRIFLQTKFQIQYRHQK